MPEWVSDAVLAAAITQIGAIMVAAVGVMGTVMILILNRTRRHAKAAATSSRITQEEVRNNHVDEDGVPLNMRDEFDDRFETQQKGQEEILKALALLGAEVRGSRRDIGRLADSDIEFSRRLTQVVERLDRHMTTSDKERDDAAQKLIDLERTIPKTELALLQKRENDDPK